MMTTGRSSAHGARAGRSRAHPRHASAPGVAGVRATFPVDAPVVERDPGAAGPGVAGAGPAGPAAAGPGVAARDDATASDDALDVRAHELLADRPALEDLVAERLPLALVVDLLSPFGPDSERLAREERDR